VFANTQSRQQFEQDVHARILKTLAVRAVVEIVGPATFPRTDFKARRVIDDREVFREMNQKLRKA
jgi:phenylacetate-CoA ligase